MAPHADLSRIGEDEALLLADAQTSGGLLLAVAAPEAGRLVAELDRRASLAHAAIGVVVEGPPGAIRVR